MTLSEELLDDAVREVVRILVSLESGGPEVAELLARAERYDEMLRHTPDQWRLEAQAADLRAHAATLVKFAEARATLERVRALPGKWRESDWRDPRGGYCADQCAADLDAALGPQEKSPAVEVVEQSSPNTQLVRVTRGPGCDCQEVNLALRYVQARGSLTRVPCPHGSTVELIESETAVEEQIGGEQ